MASNTNTNTTRIKLHNPELSANSKLYNLVLEDDSAGVPVDPKAGRIWFNTVDQAVQVKLGSGAEKLATTTGVEARLGIAATTTVADQLALKLNEQH